MLIKSIGSGSGGNSFFLEIGGKRFLIDLGLNTKAITNGLKDVNLEPSQLDAVFITHTHSDHVSALPVMKKRLTCPYYMSELSHSKLFLPNTVVLTPGVPATVAGAVRVTAQTTSHDCPGSLCFRFDCGEESFGYATDLGHMSEEIFSLMLGVKAIVIESNHDTEMLKNGPYPFVLKRRILSESGHLSNDDCCKVLSALVAAGTEHVYLAHLSRENNTPDRALETVCSALDMGRVHLTVLSPFGNPPEKI